MQKKKSLRRFLLILQQLFMLKIDKTAGQLKEISRNFRLFYPQLDSINMQARIKKMQNKVDELSDRIESHISNQNQNIVQKEKMIKKIKKTNSQQEEQIKKLNLLLNDRRKQQNTFCKTYKCVCTDKQKNSSKYVEKYNNSRIELGLLKGKMSEMEKIIEDLVEQNASCKNQISTLKILLDTYFECEDHQNQVNINEKDERIREVEKENLADNGGEVVANESEGQKSPNIRSQNSSTPKVSFFKGFEWIGFNFFRKLTCLQ